MIRSPRPSQVGDPRPPICEVGLALARKSREQAMRELYAEGWGVDGLARLYHLPVSEVIRLTGHRIHVGGKP